MRLRSGDQGEIVDAVARLHAEVGRAVAPLEARHAERLNCRRGCAGCCIDGLTVFEVEAENIRRNHADLLAHGTPHPPGACAFLDEAGGCRIYAHRPYVCRTQGLPLRWLDDGPDDGFIELRDICPLNDAGPPLETLPADACWTLGPVEARLATLQAEAGGGPRRRVAFRDLFGQPAQGQSQTSTVSKTEPMSSVPAAGAATLDPESGSPSLS